MFSQNAKIPLVNYWPYAKVGQPLGPRHSELDTGFSENKGYIFIQPTHILSNVPKIFRLFQNTKVCRS